jgi:hypothetical protein
VADLPDEIAPGRIIVQFSTGLGSAEVADRLIQRHGGDRVVLLTADTRVEDPDNWRFAHEFVNKRGQGCQWVILADGRTPMQAGRDERAVPSNRMPICSRVLKTELLRKWIDANCDPAVDSIAIGFDWTEPKRLADAVPHWAPFQVVAPLMDEPLIEKWNIDDRFRNTLGITPPRLYDLGYPHANCGGFCVRAGQAAWAAGLRNDRDGYLAWEAEEQATIVHLGKKVTILKDRRKVATATNNGKAVPLTLREFRERIEAGGEHDGDYGHCGCDPFAVRQLSFDEAS